MQSKQLPNRIFLFCTVLEYTSISNSLFAFVNRSVSLGLADVVLPLPSGWHRVVAKQRAEVNALLGVFNNYTNCNQCYLNY